MREISSYKVRMLRALAIAGAALGSSLAGAFQPTASLRVHNSVVRLPPHFGPYMSKGTLHPDSRVLTQGARCPAAVRGALQQPRVPRYGLVALRLSGTPMDQARSKPPLDLTEENVATALEEAKEVLGTIFGNSAENRNIGITGDVQLADIDGPFIIVRLVGRFWHKRADVLARVENYVLARIPEAIELQIEDPSQLDDTNVEGGYEIQDGESPAGTAARQDGPGY